MGSAADHAPQNATLEHLRPALAPVAPFEGAAASCSGANGSDSS
jgi:hypothetical protein